jgi:hypothetical protein
MQFSPQKPLFATTINTQETFATIAANFDNDGSVLSV